MISDVAIVMPPLNSQAICTRPILHSAPVTKIGQVASRELYQLCEGHDYKELPSGKHEMLSSIAVFLEWNDSATWIVSELSLSSCVSKSDML